MRGPAVSLNVTPSVSRRELELLEATLVNCRRSGAKSQNRTGHDDFRAHLAGRIAWVSYIHTAKGQRLRALFDAIDWST